jgi:hypothetical protein
MKTRYLSLSACLALLLIVAAPVLAQGNVTVTAEVDRTGVSTDDLLTLTLTVAGDFQQLGEPQLPLLTGFNLAGSSRSSQFSMVNGVVTARTVFTYRLQPTAPGSFTIEPITVQVNGSSFQTEPITVEVVQGTAPTPTPQSAAPAGEEPSVPPPGALEGQDFYVATDVDNPTPFVGQQIIYRFRFYQAVNLFNQPLLDLPAFSGFWTEALAPNRVFEQTAAGRPYRVTEVRQALFPTAAGPVTLEPATLTIPGDFFSRDVVLESQPVEVNVQPLPAEAPEDFEGAVGQFEISAWAEPAETRVNEPVTLFVRVQGAGNLNALPDPTADAENILPDWRVYDPQITTNVTQEGDRIKGEKLFERLLVPRSDGQLDLPSFSMVYFDPETGTYERAATEPLTVQVAPGEGDSFGPIPNAGGKQDVVVLGSDIRHIKAAPPALATGRPQLLGRPLYWLGWVLPLLAVAGVWAWDRHRHRLSSDVARAAARSQRARRLARKRLARARQQARQDQDAAYAAVARALTDYLGDKFNLPAAGLTRDAIRQTLAARNVPADLIARTLSCLDWADSGRFAPVAAGRGADTMIAEAEAVLGELEQTIAL